MKKRIDFVMLTWNRYNFLAIFFDLYYKRISGKNPYCFTIVDNGFQNGSLNLLKVYQQKAHRINWLYNDENRGLNEYKSLFKHGDSEFIVIIGNDILDFPGNFDALRVDVIKKASDNVFLALDVIQNEFTIGTNPSPMHYRDVERGIVISDGAADGWCTIFRRVDIEETAPFFDAIELTMGCSEDCILVRLIYQHLRLRQGIIKVITCFHACGHIIQKCLDRDILKYQQSGSSKFIRFYKIMFFNYLYIC